MNKSVGMPLEKLIHMKEKEIVSLLEVSLTNKGLSSAPQLSLGVDIDMDFVMFISPFVEEIMNCLKKAIETVDIGKLAKQKETIPFATVHLFADENGFNVGSRFYHIEEEDLKGKGAEFYLKLNHLLGEVIENVNELTGEYAMMVDNDEIFSPQKFEFIYSKSNSEWKWKYESFVRMTDRKISEQKQEIHSLMKKNIDKKLLEITKIFQPVESNKMIVKFLSDGLSVKDIKVGMY